MSTTSHKQRILFFVPLPPPIHGPALRNQSLINSKILNDAFELDVLPFNFVTTTENIGKFSWLKISKSFVRGFDILVKLMAKRPDLVYLNPSLYGFALYRDWAYILIFKSFRVRLLYHLRTQGVDRQVQASYLKKVMFKWMFRNERVICLSNNLCQDISKVCQEQPLVIPNGIEDLSMLFPKRNHPRAKVSILFLANLAKTKGIIELLKAFQVLQSRAIHFEGNIVGNPVDLSLEFVSNMINDLNLTQQVNLLGPKYDSEKYEILTKADILVLPTYFEAFPGIILEAMQFAIPVISTFEGAIPEIVDHGITGLLVEKQNVESLANTMETLVNNSELREKLGRNGRLKFEREYTLEKFENNMKVAFQACLQNH